MLLRGFVCVWLVFFLAVSSANSRGFPKKVLMFLWRGETQVEQGFKSGLEKYAVDYQVVNIKQDTKNLKSWLDAHPSLCEHDLIYTWGTTISRFVYQHLQETRANVCADGRTVPMLFTMVAFPIEAGLIKSFDDKASFLTGVTHSAPLKAQLQAMEHYAGKHRQNMKVAVFYNQLESNARLAAENMMMELGSQDIPIEVYTTMGDGSVTDSEFYRIFEHMGKQSYDFVYTGPDSFLASKAEMISRYAKFFKVPIYSVSELMIKKGAALFGLVSSYYGVGQVTANRAEQLLINRRSPKSIAVSSINGFLYLLNIKLAKSLEKYPDILLLRQAKIIGGQ